MPKRKPKEKRKQPPRDPLHRNPVVGGMSEAQAERILSDMRDEERRGVQFRPINLTR